MTGSSPDRLDVIVPSGSPKPTPRGFRSLLRILLAATSPENETKEAA